MTKEELLEKAKRDYTVGTVFISAFDDAGRERTMIPYNSKDKEFIFSFESNDSVRISNGIKSGIGCSNPRICAAGKWAQIVSKPEVSVYPTDVKYQKGDKVKVLRKAKDHERGWQMVWIDSMSSKVGEVLTVKEDNSIDGVLMEEGCKYPHFVLEKVETDVMKELTELPEKWCVKGSNELTRSGFRDWEGNSRGLCGDAKSYYHFNGWNYINYQATVKNGYTEITVYQFKRWVLKESDTLKVEDLVEGEIYFHDTGSYSYIIHFERSESSTIIGVSYVDIKNRIYGTKYRNTTIKELRKATDEEKQWLQACIKAGEFVSLEDSKGMLSGEELLKEAKRRYPIGTNVKSLVASFKGVVKSHVCSSKGEEQVWFSANTCNVLVYAKGKWAEVIEPAVSPLVEGRLEMRKRKFIDWYQENLPPHLAKRAIEYFDPTYSSSNPTSASDYLPLGFSWSNTAEKFNFWDDLNVLIHRGEDIQSYGMGIRDQILTPSQSYEPIEIVGSVSTELIMLKTTTI